LSARLLAVLLAGLVAPLLLLVPASCAQTNGFDVQAHAGGRGETTGESLRAFAKAIQTGVNTLELDINITKDGQPVVWHDPVIKSEQCADTGPAFDGDPAYPYVGKLVHELTLAQVRTLDCGKPASEFPAAEVVWGNKIAVLAEVFALAGPSGVRYNIETKVAADHPGTSADPQEFVEVVLAAVRAAGQADRVEIQSFDWSVLPLVRQVEPSMPLVALWDEQTWVPGSPWLAGIDATRVGDPMIGAMTAGAGILSPNYQQVDKAFVDRAHALGLRVIPWTVDNPDAMRQQIAAGVDGIITNYPTRLRGVLGALGISLPPAY
jgi:glycerophosphoryl diester phosphodiesterase